MASQVAQGFTDPTGSTVDAVGNLTYDGNYRYAYDTWNGLVTVQRPSDNVEIAIYRYDAWGKPERAAPFRSLLRSKLPH